MDDHSFPITSSSSDAKCVRCHHYVQSGMSRDGQAGYCFYWTWKSDGWVITKETDTCPSFVKTSRKSPRLTCGKLVELIALRLSGRARFK